MKLGDVFLDFKATTDRGHINSFHEWMGEGNWAILFSHPADFTPVCTTELGRAAVLAGEFTKRKVKMLALSCDSAESHRGWIKDICAYVQSEGNALDESQFPFEIIADDQRVLAEKLEMLDPWEIGKDGLPLTARAVFIVGPKKTLRSMILYPATTGRDFNEILRVIDSLQLTDQHPVATPEGWRQKGKCMVQPSLSKEKAQELFGNAVQQKDLPSGRAYMRFVSQP